MPYVKRPKFWEIARAAQVNTPPQPSVTAFHKHSEAVYLRLRDRILMMTRPGSTHRAQAERVRSGY